MAVPTPKLVMSSPSLTLHEQSGVFVSRFFDRSPDNGDWDRACVHFAAWQRQHARPLTLLVLPTARSVPSAAQRARFAEVVGPGSRIAVLHDSVIIRSVTKAVGFFFDDTRVQSFAQAELPTALEWLGMDSKTFATFSTAIESTRPS